MSYKRNHSLVQSVVALILATLAAISVFGAKGNLDAGFATRGKFVPSLAGTEKAYDTIVQPDGKIVVVGGIANAGSQFDFFVQRLNADGSPDETFANAIGRASYSYSPSSEVANTATLQSDGKIIVVGYVQAANNYGDFGILRLNSDGSPDETFGPGGWRVVSMTQTTDIAVAVSIQPIGGVEKILVAGNSGTANVTFGFVRLNPDGAVDTTFGTAGMTLLGIGGVADSLQDMTLDGSGRIVAAGFSRFDFGLGSYRDDFAAVRLLANGMPDASFSGDGKVVTQMAGSAQPRSIAVQNIGGVEKIVVGGLSRVGVSDDFAFLRYTPDGALDTTFGSNGRVYIDFNQNDDQALDINVQRDGKIVGVGLARLGANQDFAATRLTVNGQLDKTFGACGRVRTDLGTFTDIAYGATLDANDRIIAVGESTNGANADFAVVRYTNGGQATAMSRDFDGDGKDDVAVFRPSTGVWYANCSCQGFRAVQFGLPGDVPQAADYDGDGRTDQAVFRGGRWFVLRSSDGGATVVDFGTNGDIPTVGDYDGDDKADFSVWRPSTGVWYVFRSSDYQWTATAFGLNGDRPAPADFDGDGKTDLAVYRNGDWWMKHSSNESGDLGFSKFGIAADVVAVGDFDGDGKADQSVFRATEGTWFQQLPTHVRVTRFGSPTDKPAPADFDGDGKADIAIFRSGQWHVIGSSTNAYSVTNFGIAEDLPAVVR